MDTKGNNPQLKWPLHHDNNQSLTSNSCDLMPSIPQQPRLAPPITATCSYAVLDLKKSHTGAGQLPQTDQVALEPNPLYQASSVVHSGQMDQPGLVYDNRAKPIDNMLLAENPYQDILEQCDYNTYEDIRVTDSNTYASLDEIQPHTQNIMGKKVRPDIFTNKYTSFLH